MRGTGTPDDLLAGVVRSLTNRNLFALTAYEDIVIGNTNQAGEDARNVARHAGLLAGLPESVAGITVNRLCGSGLAAVLDAARAIRCGEGQLLIAGGTESMSRAPFVMARPRRLTAATCVFSTAPLAPVSRTRKWKRNSG